MGDKEARREALIFNAAKRALHARFTPDQRFGNVFAYDGGLRYQPPVRAFIDRAQARFENACPDVAQRAIDADIARLAEQMFNSVRRADTPGYVGVASAAN